MQTDQYVDAAVLKKFGRTISVLFIFVRNRLGYFKTCLILSDSNGLIVMEVHLDYDLYKAPGVDVFQTFESHILINATTWVLS